jgi:mannose-1-phosphate guanylyltransferase
MQYALIIAGGSGTRLWPMSRSQQPKQLIPFINGRSLLQIARDRLSGLLPADRCYICAGQSHKQAILENLPGLHEEQYLGEPTGRDTLNAVGLAAAVIAERDPQAVIAVFTADHIIEPVDRFQQCVRQGFELAQADQPTLVTFGIRPTHAATGYGYLQLGESLQGEAGGVARKVVKFKEKPDAPTAQSYLQAGPSEYLWNSGMFVWKASVLMDCIARYAPENHAGLVKIAKAWDTSSREAVAAEVYPTLKKISVDFAIMEPASRDPKVRVAAVPMDLTWLDVGSWPSYGETCKRDEQGNTISTASTVHLDSRGVIVASSDDKHLVATIGCENMIIIHTPHATLVCPADRAEEIKKLHEMVGEKVGKHLL